MDKRFTPLAPSDEILHRRQLLASVTNTPGLHIPDAIRRLREGMRITLEEYARISGVSARAIHAIENGQGNPTLATLEKLLQPFGLTVGITTLPSPLAKPPGSL